MPPGAIEQLFGYGVLGVVVVLFMLGILVPKWVVDEYRVRLKGQDVIIERLASGLERLADRAEDRK